EVTRTQGLLGKAYDMASASILHGEAKRETSSPLARTAAMGVAISLELDRAPTFMEDFVKRFVDVEPSPLTNGVVPLFSVLSACGRTPNPTGKRCIDRMSQLYHSGHFGAAITGADELVTGMNLFMAGDIRGAAMAWRPLTRLSSSGSGA